MHNIRVDRSTVGTINTGAVQTLDSAVTVLKNQGDQEASRAIRELTQAVVDRKEIDEQTRKDVIDLLSAIATQAASPKEQQKPAVVKPLIERVSTLLGQVTDLAGKVKDFMPVLTGFFGG